MTKAIEGAVTDAQTKGCFARVESCGYKLLNDFDVRLGLPGLPEANKRAT